MREQGYSNRKQVFNKEFLLRKKETKELELKSALKKEGFFCLPLAKSLFFFLGLRRGLSLN